MSILSRLLRRRPPLPSLESLELKEDRFDPRDTRTWVLVAHIAQGYALYKTLRGLPPDERRPIAISVQEQLRDLLNHVYEVASFPACGQCRENYGHGYMLTEEIWHKITADDPQRFLCLSCAQQRLGRSLALDDFPAQWPINNPIRSIFELWENERSQLHQKLGDPDELFHYIRDQIPQGDKT